MKHRTLVNLSAVAVILAGGTLLSAARPAEGAFVGGGCATMLKAVGEEATACNKLGGTYTWTGSCTDDHYDISSSCDVP